MESCWSNLLQRVKTIDWDWFLTDLKDLLIIYEILSPRRPRRGSAQESARGGANARRRKYWVYFEILFRCVGLRAKRMVAAARIHCCFSLGRTNQPTGRERVHHPQLTSLPSLFRLVNFVVFFFFFFLFALNLLSSFISGCGRKKILVMHIEHKLRHVRVIPAWKMPRIHIVSRNMNIYDILMEYFLFSIIIVAKEKASFIELFQDLELKGPPQLLPLIGNRNFTASRVNLNLWSHTISFHVTKIVTHSTDS